MSANPSRNWPPQDQWPTFLFYRHDDEDVLQLIRDMVAHEDGDLMPIRLLLGDGHSGHGLYIASADYPEEGAHLLTATPPLATAPEAQP